MYGVNVRLALAPITHDLAVSVFSDSSQAGGFPPVNESASIDGEEEEEASDEDEDQPNGSVSSSRQPSKDAISKWNNVLNFAKMPVKSTFGPGSSRLTKRWGGGDDASASFRAPTPDPCLLQAFDKAKTANKSLVDSASAIASSSGAAAHAILSASETLESCIAEFQRIAASQEEGWKDFFLNSAEALKLNALAPLNDALSLQASAYGRAVGVVRSGVVAAAETPVKPVLKAVPPSGGFYFGDPAERVMSAMNYALVASQLRPSSRGGRGSAPSSSFGRSASSRATATTSASKKSSPAASSSTSSRPFPRGKGGKRGK